MLETLSRGFRQARLKLQGKGILTEANIRDALREVRVSLLEADVELGVVKSFLQTVQDRANGEVVALRAGRGADGIRVTPGEKFVKICHDELVALMGEEEGSLDLDANPAVVMMVGLQGSGKTTTAGKLARMLKMQGHKPMLVAADIYRPAAVDQLTTIGRKLGIPVFYIRGMKPVQLCQLAIAQARNVQRNVVIFDTAGRLAIDNALMDELVQIRQQTNPSNILFVCDAMIGQDAVRTASEFDKRLDFTGFVLTKMDGDARGGAALSIRKVTGKPIKFLGMGEAMDELESFRAEGLAGRILGMGDIVGLVRDFEQVADREQAEQDAEAMLTGDFTFDSFLNQIQTIQKMGSLKDVVGKMPLFSDMLDQLPPDALDDAELKRIEAIIQSMTRHERQHPDIMNPSRMKRIAMGSGTGLEDVKAIYERFLMARKTMQHIGKASGLFGSLKQTRKARKMLARAGGAMDANPLAGMFGTPPKVVAPTRSPQEKIARRKKQKAARRARRKQRGRRK